jgi:endosialidase-like protein
MANQSQFWADYYKKKYNSGDTGTPTNVQDTANAAATQTRTRYPTDTKPAGDLTASQTFGSTTPGKTYQDWIAQEQNKGRLGSNANDLALGVPSKIDPSESKRERISERKTDFYYGGTKDYAQKQADLAQRTGAGYADLFTGYGGDLRKMGDTAYNRGGPDQARQTDVYNAYMGLAKAPEGLSAAQAQLNAATNANMANNLAIARSGSGMGESAGATRAALAQNMAAGVQAGNASAMLRAQEQEAYKQRQLAALGAAGGVAGGMTDAELKARGLSDSAALGYSTLGLQGYQAGAQTDLSGQQLANQIQQAALTGQMGYESNLLNQYGIEQGKQQAKDAAEQQREAALWNAAGTTTATLLKASDRRVKTDLYALSDEEEKDDETKISDDQDELTEPGKKTKNPYAEYLKEQKEKRRAAIADGVGSAFAGFGYGLSDENSKKEIEKLRFQRDEARAIAGAFINKGKSKETKPPWTIARPDLPDEAVGPPAGVPTKEPPASIANPIPADAPVGYDAQGERVYRFQSDAGRPVARYDAGVPTASRFTSEQARDIYQPRVIVPSAAPVTSDKRAKELQAELDALKSSTYRAPAYTKEQIEQTPAFKFDNEAGIWRAPMWDAEDRAAEARANRSVGRFPDVSGSEAGAQQMVRSAPGYAYKYKDSAQAKFGEDDRTHYGPMAQDLEKTPMGASTVVEGPGGTKMVDTPKLTLANTAAASGQQKELDELRRQLAALTSRFEKTMQVQ